MAAVETRYEAVLTCPSLSVCMCVREHEMFFRLLPHVTTEMRSVCVSGTCEEKERTSSVGIALMAYIRALVCL